MMTVDDLDFNDNGICPICQENSIVLLTNDGDFKSSDLEIISGHPKILQ